MLGIHLVHCHILRSGFLRWNLSMRTCCKILEYADTRQLYQQNSMVLCDCCGQHSARYSACCLAILYPAEAGHANTGEGQLDGHLRFGWNVRSFHALLICPANNDTRAAIASVCRLYALYLISVSSDITWDSPASVYWSAIELNVGILCASLPTLRPFLARVWPNAFSSSIGSQRVGESSGNKSGGQYYNMEGSIMVRKTVALQSTKNVADVDRVLTHQEAPTNRVGESWADRTVLER
jgi:hypothetical protein